MIKFLPLIIGILLICSCGDKSAQTETSNTPSATNQMTQQPTARQAPKTVTASTPSSAITKRATTPSQGGEYKPKNEGWYVHLDKAFAESKETGKPIMANFTGSDWCGWCKRLDRSVFHQPDFKQWADENVVLLELDFPRRFRLPEDISRQNRGLAQSLGVRGYPTIWLFDMDRDATTGQYGIKALGKTGYTKTFTEFKKTIKSYLDRRPS